jgi:preprotein translocase subunit SecD
MKNLPLVLLLVFAALVLACSGAVGIVAWISSVSQPGPEPVGVVLVYEVVPSPKSAAGPVKIQEVIEAAGKRINPAGAQRARIERIDGSHIEIAVLGEDPEMPRRIEWLLASPGTLRMRLLANQRAERALVARAARSEDDRLKGKDGEWLARWVPVYPAAEADLRAAADEAGIVLRQRQGTLRALVLRDEVGVNGSYLRRAVPSVDRRGRPSLTLHITMGGWQQFHALIDAHRLSASGRLARRLAIIVDGRLYSAPPVDLQMSDWVQITGDFTEEELADVAAVLEAGPLPAKLKDVDRRTAEAGP